MNPLPRLLGLGLLLILIALAVMLAGQSWQRSSFAPAPTTETGVNSPARRPPPAMRVIVFSQRMAFPLALTGVAVAAGLLASLALSSHRAETTPRETTALATTRTEVGALAKLAESSVAQRQELVHERGERQRAEADASLHQQLLNQSVEEKIRLGRDLHDGIIQSLYAAGLTIESARAVARADPAEADRQLARCREGLNRTIRDVRAYIAGLAPEQVRQTGFTQAMTAIVAELNAGRSTAFELKIDETATNLLSLEQTTEALQIAREAISNSLRHGEATHVTVRLHPGEGEVCLLVQDNGRGFDPTRAQNGFGLGNIQARAAGLGGTVRVESAAGNGTRVVLTLPSRV